MLRLKIGKSSNRQYLSVVYNYWDPESKQSRTKTFESIGYLDNFKDVYEDPIEHFKKYVEELNKTFVTSPNEIKVSINKRSLIDTDASNRKNLGYSTLLKIYNELNLDRFFLNCQRGCQFSYSVNDIMKLLIFQRILSPGSKRNAYLHKDKYFMNTNFNLEDIYKCLTHVNNYSDKLQVHLHKNIKEKLGFNNEIVYYDVTNYYFEIDKQDDLRKKGVSKEHRPNPIVQMGMFMDSRSIPIAYRLFKGNTNDVETLIPLVSDLRSKFNINRTIVVADKGLNSSDNIAFNTIAKNGYVFSQTIRGADRELKDYVLNQEGYKLINSNFKAKSRVYPREISVTTKDNKKKKVTIEQKQVVIYSEKYNLKAKAERQAVIEKAYDLIDNVSKYKQATSYGAAKYVKNITVDNQTGEITTSKQKPVFDIEKLREEEKYDGYYVLVTGELDKSDEQILEIYSNLWKIEECFRITKSDLNARPVYLSREDRIQAHFLICFIALTIIKILALKLDNQYSIKQIIESLNNMSYSLFEENIYIGDYSDQITLDIKEKLDIDLTRKYLTLGEIKKLFAKPKKAIQSAST